MVIPLECKYALRIIALTKLGFIMMRSRRRITKTKLEAFPVLGSRRRGTL